MAILCILQPERFRLDSLDVAVFVPVENLGVFEAAVAAAWEVVGNATVDSACTLDDARSDLPKTTCQCARGVEDGKLNENI